ncbi:hypothetical protein [Planotetraspora phitsanulokensis]|nr:hypothetical protein [Planotetraspora phitsanulokensis]
MADGVRFKVKFNQKVTAEELTDKTRRSAARGLTEATEHVLSVSNQRVPHDVGDLERSGAALVDETELVGIVSYNTEYAVVQHENLDYKHKDGRTAKFLELAAREEAEVVRLKIAKTIREAFK